MDNTNEILMSTKALTEANAKSINALTEAVRELANTVKEEDKELRSSVLKLIEVQTECKYKWDNIDQRLNDKKEILDEVKVAMLDKAQKKDIVELKDFLHKSLWWLFGGMVGIIGFLLKQTVFKGM